MPPSALACGEVVTLQTHDSPPCACAHRAEGTPRARSCRCPAAADAAARLKDFDGAVLTSPVTAGTARGRKAWAAQSVYDNPREEIRLPLLVGQPR